MQLLLILGLLEGLTVIVFMFLVVRELRDLWKGLKWIQEDVTRLRQFLLGISRDEMEKLWDNGPSIAEMERAESQEGMGGSFNYFRGICILVAFLITASIANAAPHPLRDAIKDYNHKQKVIHRYEKAHAIDPASSLAGTYAALAELDLYLYGTEIIEYQHGGSSPMRLIAFKKQLARDMENLPPTVKMAKAGK